MFCFFLQFSLYNSLAASKMSYNSFKTHIWCLPIVFFCHCVSAIICSNMFEPSMNLILDDFDEIEDHEAM